MNPNQIRDCLDVGLEAVLAAGPIALEYFRRPITVENKRSGAGFDNATQALQPVARKRGKNRTPKDNDA